ncbi:hypothetical protein MUN74_15795 [Agromyces endophyticus]|uniref:hypothetical protein n=1 Tax=Agromyces sp. H17E-10 TaxID=2932244 RepID=UPI001FD3FA33|nr:hypothetical protein [Agromyces sp. H17E-10]UOQ88712.1 hypothetical protein MUN74_15795 [Agromyces sp. H17E-10]
MINAAANEDLWHAAEWLSFWQLVVTVIGLGLAVAQLWRTADATVASKDLLARRLLSNDLLVMLPEIHTLEDELLQSVKSNDPDLVVNALLHLSRRAGSILGHLAANDGTKDEKIIKQLRAAMKAAQAAKSELAGSPTGRPIQEVVSLTVSKLSTVSTEASELVARLQKEAK